MRWLRGGLRFVLVTVGIVILTSLGIDASQYLSGSQSALGLLVDRATEGECPTGMTIVRSGGGENFCIDIYERSVSPDCPLLTMSQAADTATNINSAVCQSQTVADTVPWTYVTFHQAKELCAKSGLRLPTPNEWYQAALGTTEQSCVVNAHGSAHTGIQAACISGIGAYDMIGNVWEWVDAAVENGTYKDRVLPATGYVTNADIAGIAVSTESNPEASFHEDYFWSEPSGSLVMMRGGFYGSGSDAGLYSVHAGMESNFSGAAVGFRCVK